MRDSTVIVWLGSKPVKIRLFDIDCKDYRHPHADQARYFTKGKGRLGLRVRIDSKYEHPARAAAARRGASAR